MDFSYGNKQILHDINLTIDRPGLVCVVGPNGVGKSTLIKCILGICKPQKGSVRLDGKDISEMSLKDLSRIIGYVPVTSNDVFSMNVMDTVMMGRFPHQRAGMPSELDWKIVKRSMNMMKVRHLALQNFNELSAGQHQKVSVTKGLAQTPRILILDEPTSNLDVRHQLQVTETLREISHQIGMIVIMVSHDLNLSSMYADTIIIMSPPGTIGRVGTPQEVFTKDIICKIYGVECEVIDHKGRPHIILEGAIDNKETVRFIGMMSVAHVQVRATRIADVLQSSSSLCRHYVLKIQLSR